MNHQRRRGLRHGFDDEYPGHQFAARKMAAEIIFLAGELFHADGADAGHDVGDALDQQERLAVRDHLL